jgi:hypothetical protein
MSRTQRNQGPLVRAVDLIRVHILGSGIENIALNPSGIAYNRRKTMKKQFKK